MAFVTAREYVLSPLTRVSSSRRCSSNTRFVRFIHTVYSPAPGTAGVLAGPPGRRAAHRPLVRPHPRVPRPPQGGGRRSCQARHLRDHDLLAAPLLGASVSGGLPGTSREDGRPDRGGCRRGAEADRSQAARRGEDPCAAPLDPSRAGEEVAVPAPPCGK